MPSSVQSGLHVESLCAAEEYRAAAALYTRVFGYSGSELSLNANLLSALRKNGGSAIGAFDAAGELIGFTYGFAATDRAGTHFHYSQAAVVDPQHQGVGVGRALKLAQREIARGWGQTRMRWTFDPLLRRNAHFNLVSLGAEAIQFERRYYDRDNSDRLLVEWDLSRTSDPYLAHRRTTAPPELAGQFGDVIDAGAGAVWIPVPTASVAAGAEAPERVRSALERTLGGRVLVSCAAVDDSTSAYLAVPTIREES